MVYIKSIIFTVLMLVVMISSYFIYTSYNDLNFINKGYDWHWKDNYFMSHGIQLTRTNDTHQLILRKVDRDSQSSIFLSTTIDNKFDVVFVIKYKCKNNIDYFGYLENSSKERIQFQCNQDDDTLYFRHAWKKLSSFNFSILNRKIIFNKDDFDLSLLKKDQFMQLHPRFFKDKNVDDLYEWRRD